MPLSWDGLDDSVCEAIRKENIGAFSVNNCTVVDYVNVTAAEGGTKYNVSASSNGWTTLSNVSVSPASAIEGGTDDEITVVQQSDIIAAENQIKASKEEENKKKLFDTIDDKYYIIDSSFEQTTSNATATPAADE